MIMDNALNPKHSSSFIPKQENAFSGFGSNVKAPKIEQNALAVDSGAPKQNFFNAFMPVKPDPKPEKKKSVFGNIARGFAKGVNPGLYHDAKANYEYGQQMKQEAQHADAQQFQNHRNQAIHGMGQLAYNLKQFGSSEERMAEAAKFAQSNGLPIPTDINEFSDDALDGQMNHAVLAGWQMPQAAERKIIEGADGYQYYQDDESRVLPNVVKAEAKLTPSQAAADARAKERIEFDREKFNYQKANPKNGITVRPDGTVQVGGPVQGLGYGTAPKGKESAIVQGADGEVVVSPSVQQKTYNQLMSTNHSLETSDKVVLEDIDRALGLTEGDLGELTTTGFAGAMLDAVPGTRAHDLSQVLNTIKANIGFDKLQNMRDNSPTGGALGAINNTELGLLQSVFGALEQSQSLEQFRYNLNRLKMIKETMAEQRAAAFAQDYPDLYETAEFRNQVNEQVKELSFDPATGKIN